jgi:Uma2 family endonuclease
MAYPDLVQNPLVSHAGPWTEADFLGLPEEYRGVELLDGQLVVSPGPAAPHQRVLRKLTRSLEDAAPSTVEVFPGLDVRLARDRILVPDVVIVHGYGFAGRVVDADRVAAVLEIVSPGSRLMDRAIKPRLYAEAGIPGYVRIEGAAEAPTIEAFALRDGTYEPAGIAQAVGFPVEIDPAQLVD